MSKCALLPAVVLAFLTADALAGDATVVVEEARRVTFRVYEDAKWRPDLKRYVKSGFGTGIGFRKDGWVLVTAHQVEDAENLILICPDGVGRKADRWQWSNRMDLAVVHIPDYEVPVATFADSESVAAGDTVYTAGNPFGLPDGLSRGIVSGLHAGLKIDGERTEDFQDYVQFDAAANSGNSGGPLLTEGGEVIGLVCESLSALPRSVAAVSFAIPSVHALRLGNRLITAPKALQHGGFDCYSANCSAWPQEERKRLDYWMREGAILHDVEPSAKQAGLREDDIVLAVDGVKIGNWVHFHVLIAMREPGEKVRLDLHRKGALVEIEVEIGTWKSKD